MVGFTSLSSRVVAPKCKAKDVAARDPDQLGHPTPRWLAARSQGFRGPRPSTSSSFSFRLQRGKFFTPAGEGSPPCGRALIPSCSRRPRVACRVVNPRPRLQGPGSRRKSLDPRPGRRPARPQTLRTFVPGGVRPPNDRRTQSVPAESSRDSPTAAWRTAPHLPGAAPNFHTVARRRSRACEVHRHRRVPGYRSPSTILAASGRLQFTRLRSRRSVQKVNFLIPGRRQGPGVFKWGQWG
ncbi:hypothetical protein NDU88_000408 [Pleurodeles waltl]|uniref:Uncharacterized protein n=1 Tax=Pleurodeles waltl TaxID=8319 RepID=A0AAV7S8I7_PLEWA|nr:hypothetical protein NDU88_000408 [Pleurodeles waltl]